MQMIAGSGTGRVNMADLRNTKKRNHYRAAAIDGDGQRVRLLLGNRNVPQKCNLLYQTQWIEISVPEEIVVHGLPVPKMKSDCRTPVKNELTRNRS